MPTTITASFVDTISNGGDYMDSLDVTHNAEIIERRGTNGDFKKVKNINPTNDIEFKGGGDVAIAMGSATIAIAELTGGVKMVSKYKHGQKNNDFDDYECSAKHYPSATAA